MKSNLDNIKEKIYNLEISLIDIDFIKDIESIKLIIADDFTEFGSSGSVYSKNDLLEILPKIESISINITDFKVKYLNDNTILATYKSIDNTTNTEALRASVWIERNGTWQIIFHQGTTINKT